MTFVIGLALLLALLEKDWRLGLGILGLYVFVQWAGFVSQAF